MLGAPRPTCPQHYCYRDMVASRGDNSNNHPALKDGFRQVSKKTAELVGTPAAFLGSVLLILIWGGSGPLFHFSDTWQLVINTATTIITFLMVFLIQNTQNRDSRAIHLKLDELIKAVHTARNSVIDLDRLTDEEMKELENEYKKLCGRSEHQAGK
jgi:low affinity Fe/Cu permease